VSLTTAKQATTVRNSSTVLLTPVNDDFSVMSAFLLSTTPPRNSSPVPTTPAKETLQVSTTPVSSLTPLYSDLAVSMSVTEPIRYWNIWLRTYLIMKLPDTKPIWYLTYLITNPSDKEPILYRTHICYWIHLLKTFSIRYLTYQILSLRYWTYQILNLSDTETIRYRNYQTPKLSDTKHTR
jgi:hypothetical protein